MKKIKIICTLGPSSESEEMISKLINAGMNVARINSSFASVEEIKRVAEIIRNINPNIGLLLDTEGPKLRLNNFDHEITFDQGQIIELGKDSQTSIYIDHPKVFENIQLNQKILIDDGIYEFEVVDIQSDKVFIKASQNGVLSPRKTVSIPGLHLDYSVLTSKDEQSIKAAIESNYDFIGLSFVRNVDDINTLKNLTKDTHIKIVSKIEEPEGVKNFDEILKNSDGIMVARGDLSVEIPQEQVPILQKEIIKSCNDQGKPVIVATQMLESMKTNIKPTRAEVNDVANAILDGTDAVMLSAETSVGNYPELATQVMAKIAMEMEKHIEPLIMINKNPDNVAKETLAIAQAASNICSQLPIKAILVATASGITARMISRHRITQTILAFTKDDSLKRTLALSRGVYSFTLSDQQVEGRDIGVSDIVKATIDNNTINPDDLILVVAGSNILGQGTANLLEIQTAKNLTSNIN